MTAYASGPRTSRERRSHDPGLKADGLFDQARAKVSIADLLERESVKLVRAGQELRGPCVLCDGGGGRFAVKGEKWRCYGCDLRGDVVDLAAELEKCSLVEAARWLLGRDVAASAPRPRAAREAEPQGPSKAELIAGEMWAAARPLAGTLGARYLLGRGISADVVALAAPNLRYHPFARHHWDDRARDWVKAPAMVAQVVTPCGPTGGVHATYLDRASAGKAGFRRPDGSPADKLMWGPQHRDGRPGGAWLIGPDGDGDLATGEGIETALSVVTLAARAGISMRACAALSLGRLQGGWLRDEDGCIDPFAIRPDPERPAFTWPTPPASPWGEVRIAVDRDMGDLKVKARTGRGKVCWFLLPAETRARLCGRLAVAAWKAAGAERARAIAPPPGLDFNDELRRVIGQRECGA